MTTETTPDFGSDSRSSALKLFDDGPFLGLDTWQRALLAALIAWIPLVVLGAIQGLAWGPTRAQSVLLDPAMLVRFLVSLPLLLLTAYKCSSTLDEVVGHFLKADLLKEPDRERFCANVASATRLRNSRLADCICLALAYAYSVSIVRLFLPHALVSWRTMGSGDYPSLSLAGWWLYAVSQPMYHFVLLRFLYRTVLWWQFLWRTSRLRLQLHAVHPDGAGGLGFLGLTLYAFKVPAFAISVSIAGGMANLMLIAGARLSDLWYVILVDVLLVVILFAAPLPLFFFRELSRTRLQGRLDYWVLAQTQFRQFDRKWMASDSERSEMLTVGDFSQATDLHSILERAQKMTMLPFQPMAVLTLVWVALLPFLPVIALEIPLLEILKTLLAMMA